MLETTKTFIMMNYEHEKLKLKQQYVFGKITDTEYLSLLNDLQMKYKIVFY